MSEPADRPSRPGNAIDPSDFYATVATEVEVDRPGEGHSHDSESIEGLLELLHRRSDEGWEALSVSRRVAQVSGLPERMQVEHQMVFRRSSSRRKRWLYKLDGLSDPQRLHFESYLSDRHAQGWDLVGAAWYRLDESSPHDAVLIWKRAKTRADRIKN